MSKGKVLSPRWQPSPSDCEYGLALGFNGREIMDMAEDMRLWAGANSHRQIARKANWSLTFKGWMKRECKRKMEKHNGNRRAGSVLAACDRILEGFGGHEAAREYEQEQEARGVDYRAG